MLKQQHKPNVLTPFILAYREEDLSRGKKAQSAKPQDERLKDTRKVIKRLVEGVKRI